MKKIKVSLIYPAGDVSKPITYHLVRDFNLVINILHADISLNKMGKLVLDIEGEEQDIENGLKFVEEQGIKYKLFTKTIIWQEDDCIHCGACTAVCPSNALSMDKSDWSLTFDREKCLICELCVKSCPLNVMCVSI
ncbi:MAG TPA: NIL domain-containing protein [Pseudobacteroides sp.]|uniref:NIL domain-containing protein n=1 Tax=Pseudobacteroides sp. TaxID=1968840 RepID=UPI002F95985F